MRKGILLDLDQK